MDSLTSSKVPLEQHLDQIANDGFTLIREVVEAEKCFELVGQLDAQISENSLSKSQGTVYAARNLIDELPASRSIWRKPHLTQLIERVLGADAGLVRVLYFDKPSNRSWALPWHKDMTVAVVDNSICSSRFCKPTRKAGVDHFEAPLEVLQNMLTLRLHLDNVTARNGPLRVIPGSHHSGKQPVAAAESFRTIHANSGDVLAMRPLISHSSGHTDATANLHRRILHFEFCGTKFLPDDVAWHRFIPV